MAINIDLKDNRSEKIPYDYSEYPIFANERLLSWYPGYAAPSHWHDDIELVSVLEGQMSYNVNGEVVELGPGEGIFVNAGQLHHGYSANESECKFICVILHPLLLCAVPEAERTFVLPVIKNTALPYLHLQSDISWHKQILALCGKLVKDKNKKPAQLKLMADFFELWSILYENVGSDLPASKPESLNLTITKNMVGFIQQNYSSKISLEDIATAGSVGQTKCCKLFNQYFSQSPNQYLNQYRLNKSLELLQQTDMSITEIALAVGFSGSSYYAESFKQWMGVSPSVARNVAGLLD